jgi:hypothetical protein
LRAGVDTAKTFQTAEALLNLGDDAFLYFTGGGTWVGNVDLYTLKVHFGHDPDIERSQGHGASQEDHDHDPVGDLYMGGKKTEIFL